MQTKENNNVIAFFIGLFLIILIAIVTIFRSSFSQNSPDSTNTQQQDIAIENLKKSPRISTADLIKKIQAQSDVILLDIRPETEYIREHISNSQNVSIADIDETLKQLDKNKTYVIIDTDALSDSVATIINSLSSSEFSGIYYLEGGFSAWKNSFGPTISEGDPNKFVDQSKVSYIQTDKLKEMMVAGTNLAIIDVRKSTQFNEGHLKGAINIFLDDLEKRKKDIPIGKKIILYDNDGLWAFKAAVRLFDMGFFNAFSFADGLDNWKKKNYELEK